MDQEGHRLAAAVSLLGTDDERAVCRRDMPLERLSGLCDDHEQAAIIAADRESDISCEEAGGHPLLRHLSGAPPSASSARNACIAPD